VEWPDLQQDIANIVEQTKHLFNTSGYQFVRIVSVSPDERNARWNVKVDVGTLGTIIKEVTIDDKTGKVIEYH
jgi:hypothetical protein